MKRLALTALIILAAVSCGRRQDDVVRTRPFPKVSAPAMLTEQAEAVAYVAEHFWDDFTDTSSLFSCDSVIVNGVKKTELEQEYANWLALLDMAGEEAALKSVETLFRRITAVESADTSSNVFENLSRLTTLYLYDPNSPYRDEDLYLPFVSSLAHSRFTPEDKRPGYAYDARMCSLNRVGTKAADFKFRDKNGREYSLYGIDAEYVILFFSNPGCTACKEIIDALQGNVKAEAMIRSGRLAVLNIYIDSDLDEWRKYMPIYPDDWYNGYDPDYVIRTDVLYNVRAIPSLYLLDGDKTVLMKDAPQEKLFFWLENVS